MQAGWGGSQKPWLHMSPWGHCSSQGVVPPPSMLVPPPSPPKLLVLSAGLVASASSLAVASGGLVASGFPASGADSFELPELLPHAVAVATPRKQKPQMTALRESFMWPPFGIPSERPWHRKNRARVKLVRPEAISTGSTTGGRSAQDQ
jgi:hypothetical protein